VRRMAEYWVLERAREFFNGGRQKPQEANSNCANEPILKESQMHS